MQERNTVKTRLQVLQEQRDAKASARAAIHTTAGDALLTEEQAATFAALTADMKALDANIEMARTQAEEDRVAKAVATAAGNGAAKIEASKNAPPADKPFRTLGENLVAVVACGNPTEASDVRQEAHNRLVAAASGASTAVGSEAGFLIQKDFVPNLMKDSFESGALASRCSVHEVSENSDGLEVPYVDETSRATGSRWGGVQVYRRAEAETVTAKKPKLGKWESRLEDLMGLAYVTGRVMRDAGALMQLFAKAFPDEFAFKLDDEIFRGTGVGECLGLTNANSVATIAVTRTTANHIVFEDVVGMWKRVPPRSKARGAWFTNTETMPDMIQLQVSTGTSGQLVYMPPTGIVGNLYGSLFGRPVIEIEHASAIGTKGDLSFFDLEQYQLIRKGAGQYDESIHVRFLYDESALRWIVPVNGAPKVKSALTAYKGTNLTTSPYVTLS
jgi:HK97 family phage major capsid protein